MKQWLIAAGAAALMTVAAPAMAAEETVCGHKVPTAKETAEAVDAAKAVRAQLQKDADYGRVEAMINLAALNEQGDDAAPIDRARALDLYERAAMKDDGIGLEKMCIAYLLGEGRPKNISKGMGYCNKLGTRDPLALFAGAYDYQNGISGPKDEAMAMGIYVEAVNRGSGDAAVALGVKALELGKPDLARQWFRRGTYLGSADAMDALAGMTASGQGGATDAIEANWLYVNAAARGNGHAAAQPVLADDPLAKSCPVSIGPSGMSLTHSYSDKGQTRREMLTFDGLIRLLTRNQPEAAVSSEVEGLASIECYIDGANALDACILQREYPLGYGFGSVLEATFDGHMSIGERDPAGEPTVHRLTRMTVHWMFNP